MSMSFWKRENNSKTEEEQAFTDAHYIGKRSAEDSSASGHDGTASHPGCSTDSNGAGKKQPEQGTSLRKEIFDYVKLIAIVVAVMLFLQQFVVINAKIPSQSMEPTIMIGDRIFGNRLAYINSDPERYDIIIFKYPDDESRKFIKRVIGLPGDVIDIRDGDVYVNGESVPLDDDFCAVADSTTQGNLTFPLTVPEDSYFVLGDNRLYSRDSRYWDNPFVTKDEILGKAFFRYWPLNKIGLIP